jgi:hypothetical protein
LCILFYFILLVDPETGKRAFLFGTNNGLFLASHEDGPFEGSFTFTHIISIENVTQLDIRLDYGVIFALAGPLSYLTIFPLKILSHKKPVSSEGFGSQVDGTKGFCSLCSIYFPMDIVCNP